MYTYYKEINNEEHMLYAGEITEIYNILSVNNNPAYKFVSALIADYIEKLIANGVKYEQLYYQTKYGLSKVYPKVLYKAILIDLCEKIQDEYNYMSVEEFEKLPHIELTINNIKYKFKVYKGEDK